jgi:ataxia telangiectasia mutated family protein
MSLSQAESGENEETSQRIIINFIADLLFSGDRMHAGLAEETLRSILVRSVTIPETLAELQEHLSDAIVQGLYLIGGDTVVPVALPNAVTLETCFTPENIQDYNQWICQLTSALVASSAAAPVVGSLGRILAGVSGIAESLFPPVLHLVLKQDIAGTGVVHHTLSLMYSQWLSSPPPLSTPHVRALLHSILYLRKQPYPQEVTHADRLKWLDIDFTLATVAAEQCGMHTAALLFAELTSFAQPTRNSSRSTVKAVPTVSEDTMLSIYRNIDDPDSFYGVPQPPSLDLVLSRFDHEAEGFKALMFRGAKLDSQMRRVHELSAEDNGGLIKSLVGMNMNTLTYNLLSGRNVSSTGPSMVDSVLQTAMRLEQWDVRAPETATSDTATLYKVFQAVHNSMDVASVREELEAAFLHMMQSILAPSVIERTFKSSLCALGILTEIDDMITSTAPEQLRDAWINMHARESGLFSAR